MQTLFNNTNHSIDVAASLLDKDQLIAQLKAALDKAMRDQPNFLLMGDGYKYSHKSFYEPFTTKMYSYLEARGHKGDLFNEVVMVGYTYFIKRYLTGQLYTQKQLDEATVTLDQSYGGDKVFDHQAFQDLLDLRGGIAPLAIKALPEGTVIPLHNALMTLESTDERFIWMVQFIESFMLNVWYPITVATLSREVRKVVRSFFQLTSDNDENDYILNDFGVRGVSCPEQAQIGGMAHLLSWRGSDNFGGTNLINKYYNSNTAWAQSVRATEHSIMTQKGKQGEFSIIKRILEATPNGILSIVCDSYNIIDAVTYISTKLKDLVMSRNGVLVIRPDSGDPVQTLLAIYKILMANFGYTLNSKGYKVLPAQVRVIQGDGVNYFSIKAIYQALADAGIAADNLVLGMGGALLQANIERDTFKFAFKASYTEINGVGIDQVKLPMEINEQGELVASFKASKKGKMKVVKDDVVKYRTITHSEEGYDEATDELILVFLDGEMMVEPVFEDMRERAKLKEEVLVAA